MSQPWWQQFPITQGFGQNGERGTDYGVPFHTPLELPYGGTVVSEGWFGWGGEVDIATFVPGLGNVIESILHLDEILVPKGAYIPAGGVVGLSGGQLSGGEHPNNPKYSSGPHTEIDFWKGDPWSSGSYNPAPILAATEDPGIQLLGFNLPGNYFKQLPGGVDQITPGSPGYHNSTPDVFGIQAGLSSIGSDIAGIPTTIGHGLADAFTVAETDVGIFLRKQAIAAFVAALVLLVLFA